MRKFTDPPECYEFIGQQLAQAVPETWEQITVDFEIIEINSVSRKQIYYTALNKSGDRKPFHVEDPDFDNCFFQLAELTNDDWRGSFQKCRFILNHDGSFQTFFEYEQEDD
jgi:hypothetical protein